MSAKILWADDEIDLLKPQILFLEGKGYDITPVTNGQDVLEKLTEESFDVVILDESMPGLTGLETLDKMKDIGKRMPVIMITKNEEEDLMEQAIGQQITEYLIKPVKPQQILSTLKKIIDNKRLVSQHTNSAYQQEFQKLFLRLQEVRSHEEWSNLYDKLVYWELELSKSEGKEMQEIFTMQKAEANQEFNKFVMSNYLDWIENPDNESTPVMSHNLMYKKVFPVLTDEKPTVMVVIDNLRWDQWKIIQPMISSNFRMVSEGSFFSILPTATQYSRNSIFAGLTPLEISRKHADFWKNDDDDGGKNMFEDKLLEANLERSFREPVKHQYLKITNHRDGKSLEDNALNLVHNKLSVIVYNFVDMLSHARTEMEVLKELAGDETAYRSITKSWFEHSSLHNALRKLSEQDINLIITTDHGTIRVKNPSKVIGDRSTTTNIRYKAGKNLNYEAKDVFEVKKPEKAGLPSPNVSTTFIFGKEDNYLVYPNNYNHYVNYFKNTFQHGGISLEEMIVPFAVYRSK